MTVAPASVQTVCDHGNPQRMDKEEIPAAEQGRGATVHRRETLPRADRVDSRHCPAGSSIEAYAEAMEVEGTGDLNDRLVTIARLLDTGSGPETLQLIVDLAVATVPGCEHAGISFVHRRKISTPAASDAAALRVDAVQSEVGQGPCLDAMLEDQIFKTDDLSTETRWPLFAARAHAETGVRSMLGLRLFARGRTMGALNLMSTKPRAFTDESLSTAALYAAMAAVALNAAQTEETLQLALRSRDIIGQAMGILMERHGITDREAFDRLSTASQNLNVRLKDVAEQVVFTGEDSPENPGRL